MSKAKYSNKYDSFPLKSWGKEKWGIGIRDWSAASPREEKKMILGFITGHPLQRVALLLCCPHVVWRCLCLLEASAQEHGSLQMTGAPSTALGLKYLSRTLLCWLHAALAVWSGWTCELVHKAEEVFKSTKGYLSAHLSATPLKNLLPKPWLQKDVGWVSAWSLPPAQQQRVFAGKPPTISDAMLQPPSSTSRV